MRRTVAPPAAGNRPISIFGRRRALLSMNKQFTAKLQKSPAKGGWTYLVMPDSAEFFGTRGLVKVSGDSVTVRLEKRLT